MKDILKVLTIKAFHIEEVNFSKEFKISNNTLNIKENVDFSEFSNISDVSINIITPKDRNIYVNSILDVIPISTKVYGVLGSGITHTLTGVYILLTASINKTIQVKNFGACYGNLDEIIEYDSIGTFSREDYLIHFDVTIEREEDLKNTLYNCHLICEKFAKEIREVLKEKDSKDCSENHVFEEKNNKKGKKVVLIKQISGQGAMENNIILPDEPSGVLGGLSIMDIENMPLVISPNEYRDGAIRALT